MTDFNIPAWDELREITTKGANKLAAKATKEITDLIVTKAKDGYYVVSIEVLCQILDTSTWIKFLEALKNKGLGVKIDSTSVDMRSYTISW